MNNKLPAFFSFMKPVLPTATERYEIRNPSFHTLAIKHKFAECSLQYCLINQLNSENCFALLTDKVSMNSFYSFKVFVLNSQFLPTLIPAHLHQYDCTCNVL